MTGLPHDVGIDHYSGEEDKAAPTRLVRQLRRKT